MMRKEANEQKKNAQHAAHINSNTSIFLSLESRLYTYSHTTLVKSAHSALMRYIFIYSPHREHTSPNMLCVLAGISLK